MKNSLLAYALGLSLGTSACSTKSSQQYEKSASDNPVDFKMAITDTLMVDPGEEILYTQYGLSRADCDPQINWLYNYNAHDHSVEIIDLENMALEKKVMLEKEGPNGTGEHINFMDVVNGKFLLSEFHQTALFDSSAQRVMQLKLLQANFAGDTLQGTETVKSDGHVDESEQYFLTLYEKDFGEPLGIAFIRLQDKSLRKRPIPALQTLANFRVMFRQGNGKSASYPSIYSQILNEKFLISSTAVNEIYVYDFIQDSLTHHTFESQLTSNRQTDNPKTEVHSQEEMRKVSQERGPQVKFSSFVFDPYEERYYRISRDYEQSLAGGKSTYLTVLTVFDKEFNQLFETDDVPIDKFTSSFLAKKGKLYFFENIADEMGFVVAEIREN